MPATTFAKTPWSFSFSRTMLVTDGAFFNLIDDTYQGRPVAVVRHGIRATQNVSGDASKSPATGNAKDDSERGVAYVQITESAKLDPNASALVVTFDIRMLDLAKGLHSCAGDTPEISRAARESVTHFVERAKGSHGLEEVSRRIARNIANGSFLWRNRVIASEVTVDVLRAGALCATFDALKVPLTTFGDYSDAELKVAAVLAAGMRGDLTASLSVRATVKFGVSGAVEVFPSQGYIENKPKGFARPLYKLNVRAMPRGNIEPNVVVGEAALRDAKISNRLKTIDTWYPGFDTHRQPLPVEPMGASLDAMTFFRNGPSSSAFSMFARLNVIDPDSDDGMFCIATMVRGGVLGMKSAAKTAAASETQESGVASASPEAQVTES
jgi:CRISPR-associated protein Csy3